MTPGTSARPTRRGRARALAAVGALTAAVGLGACSALGDPSAAALVDGEVVVTRSDVASVIEEFPRYLANGQAPAPGEVVSFLALDEPVRDLAVETGTPVVDQLQARQFLADQAEAAGQEPARYSEPVLRLIATNLTLGAIGQSEDNLPLIEEMIDGFGDRLEVNPRYGEVDPSGEQFVVPVEHPWLVASDASAASE